MSQKAVNFQSTIGLSEYSGLEYWDNSVVRQEVAFCLTFLLGNIRDCKQMGLDKITFVSTPLLFVISLILQIMMMSLLLRRFFHRTSHQKTNVQW